MSAKTVVKGRFDNFRHGQGHVPGLKQECIARAIHGLDSNITPVPFAPDRLTVYRTLASEPITGGPITGPIISDRRGYVLSFFSDKTNQQ